MRYAIDQQTDAKSQLCYTACAKTWQRERLRSCGISSGMTSPSIGTSSSNKRLRQLLGTQSECSFSFFSLVKIKPVKRHKTSKSCENLPDTWWHHKQGNHKNVRETNAMKKQCALRFRKIVCSVLLKHFFSRTSKNNFREGFNF